MRPAIPAKATGAHARSGWACYGLSKMSDRLLTSTAAANQTTITGLHRRAVIAIDEGNVALVSTEQAGARRRTLNGRLRMSTNGWERVPSGQAAYRT